MWKLLVGLTLAAAVLLVLVWLRTPTDRALFLRRAGLVLMAVFTVVCAAWATAEAFTDPGGWRAAGLVAAWLVPLLVLLAVSWYRPELAIGLLGLLIAVAVGIGVWVAVDPEPWRAFEDGNGPVRAVVTFVLATPAALLGWTRPRPAGVLLVMLGVVPAALAAAGTVSGLGSLAAVSVAPVLAGTLYLLAGTVAQRPSATTTMPAAVARR